MFFGQQVRKQTSKYTVDDYIITIGELDYKNCFSPSNINLGIVIL